MVIVASEVERLAVALGRTITIGPRPLNATEYSRDVHIIQVCPLCEAKLGVLINDTARTSAVLHQSLFSIYDEHRCVTTIDPFRLFERAERALVAAAERIGVIDDPMLRARAEREAELMAVRANELRATMR